jgi:hypothetical protein
VTEFKVTGNTNYAPLVVDLSRAEIFPLEGRDRVVGLRAFGMNAIVGKEWVRELEAKNYKVVMIPAGSQVTEQFAHANNLHRHEHLNADVTQKGYLEDNRRVKAIRMGGHPSDALVVDPFAFGYAGAGAAVVSNLPHGTAFDTIDGVHFSKKYVKPTNGNGQSMRVRQGAAKVRVTSESFPEHFETKNLFRDNPFKPEDHVFITQKLHGTSVRLGRVPVLRDLRWHERLAHRLGVKVRTHDYKVVVGSRRVTKSIDGRVEDNKEHWFEAGDIWTKATEFMHDLLPEGFVVYAEIVGWTPDGAPIQPKYTYNLAQGQSGVYVYRVAVLAASGDLVDLPWRAVQKFAAARGWETVPELDAITGLEVDKILAHDFLDKRLFWDYDIPGWESGTLVLPLSDPDTVDEGVVVRADLGLQPTVRKAKSPIFLGHESALMDAETPDIEEEEQAS